MKGEKVVAATLRVHTHPDALGPGPSLAIDRRFVELLRQKDASSIYLWCNADEFVNEVATLDAIFSSSYSFVN
jgi:hypothetical protein